MEKVVDFNARTRAKVEEAIASATKTMKTPAGWIGAVRVPRGKVVAELNFGFWRYLSSRSHEALLWVPLLRHGFPAGMAKAAPVRLSRQAVDGAMGELHDLRNRVAHHEPLLAIDHAARRADQRLLLEFVDPGLAAYVGQRSTWAAIEGQRP